MTNLFRNIALGVSMVSPWSSEEVTARHGSSCGLLPRARPSRGSAPDHTTPGKVTAVPYPTQDPKDAQNLADKLKKTNQDSSNNGCGKR